MTEKTTHAAPLLADHAQYLITTAARAPSVHNTQPWRFGVGRSGVELYCDPRRKLRADPLGREMIISCGAALFGLRLAVRGLGYLPLIELMPDPNQPRLLARVGMGAAVPVTRGERRMLEAVPHRHTHRGPFEPVRCRPGCSRACSMTRWPRGPNWPWSRANSRTSGWRWSSPWRPAGWTWTRGYGPRPGSGPAGPTAWLATASRPWPSRTEPSAGPGGGCRSATSTWTAA